MGRNATLFVAISQLSGFGSTAMALVAGIWILDLTGSSSVAGLTGLSVYAPLLAGPWLGALVDRLPRRPMLIWVNVGVAAVLLTLVAVRSTALMFGPNALAIPLGAAAVHFGSIAPQVFAAALCLVAAAWAIGAADSGLVRARQRIRVR
jgi:hypothetical protein